MQMDTPWLIPPCLYMAMAFRPKTLPQPALSGYHNEDSPQPYSVARTNKPVQSYSNAPPINFQFSKCPTEVKLAHLQVQHLDWNSDTEEAPEQNLLPAIASLQLEWPPKQSTTHR